MNGEEATKALAEYLDDISPIFENDMDLPPLVMFAPLIEVKLTEEKLQKLNKKDRLFILVMKFGEDANYWIASPFQNGFVYFQQLFKTRRRWAEWRKWYDDAIHNGVHPKDAQSDKLMRISSRIDNWPEPYNKSIGEALNEAFGSRFSYYLLKSSAPLSPKSRTLNFSRSGFL
mgnify:CR=1 FL=1